MFFGGLKLERTSVNIVEGARWVHQFDVSLSQTVLKVKKGKGERGKGKEESKEEGQGEEREQKGEEGY